MTSEPNIRLATPDDAPPLATMVGELLDEIMRSTGVPHFDFDPEATTARLVDFLEHGHYFAFLATHEAAPAGFITLHESFALYAGGAFGTIPEFYVRPEFRSRGVGRALLVAARALGRARGWARLEVTTPPLPAFDRTLAFYATHGFAITGGRKLKVGL